MKEEEAQLKIHSLSGSF